MIENLKNDPSPIIRRAFTLVEMLIAMTLTLLMMAAIARSFAFVGERIRDSRADLKMSLDLLDSLTRLQDELSRCTVSLDPMTTKTDQSGYFEYYEGPLTDSTSSLFRATGTDSEPELPDSRIGDLDDYLAFTAIAPPGSWFTGKVPRYILDQRENPGGYSLPSGPYDDDATTATPQDPFTPVVIRSRYAEIVYYVVPEYEEATLPASPTYVDVDGDTDLGSGNASQNGYPDRVRLHRRVLLIRPDLNVNGLLPAQLYVEGSLSIPFMQADEWPTATTATVNASANLADGWLYGLAGVHQQCDLSVSRAFDSIGVPSAAGSVVANSLDDLTLPHNRFAHVRVPFNVMQRTGSASSPTSMPMIALGERPTVLNMVSEGGTRIAPSQNFPGGTAGAVITSNILSGFLRPEFVLGLDRNHLEDSGPRYQWGRRRVAEDVVVNNLLAFDVKIYDPEAVAFTTISGLVVGPSDAGYREALFEATSNVTQSEQRGEFAGNYVDLMYPVLAGGSLRGWQLRVRDRNDAGSASTAIPTNGNYLITPFSGIDNYTVGATAATAYSNALYRSGAIVTQGNVIQLFQPRFDTFTRRYETDGFLQSRQSNVDEGTLWTMNHTTLADHGADGLDGAGIYGGGTPLVAGNFGADDLGERETLPPFERSAESVKVTIRLENPSTRQVMQRSTVYRPSQK